MLVYQLTNVPGVEACEDGANGEEVVELVEDRHCSWTVDVACSETRLRRLL